MKNITLLSGFFLVVSWNISSSLGLESPWQKGVEINLLVAQAQGPPTSQDSPPPPDPPITPNDLPAGESCLGKQESLELPMATIRPKGSENALTGNDTPTLFFYIPYGSESTEMGEFTILTRERQDGREIYRTQFQLPEPPGIVSLTIPQPLLGKTSHLEEGIYYRWVFSITCKTGTQEPFEQKVRGWIRRLPSDLAPEETRFYYDELADSVSQIPNSESEGDWVKLLHELGLENYTSVPVIGPVTLIPNGDA